MNIDNAKIYIDADNFQNHADSILDALRNLFGPGAPVSVFLSSDEVFKIQNRKTIQKQNVHAWMTACHSRGIHAERVQPANGRKNSTDIALIVRIFEDLFSEKNPDDVTVVIVSGDSDFVHVIKALKKIVKDTIICGNSNTNSSYKNTTRYINFETLIGANEPESLDIAKDLIISVLEKLPKSEMLTSDVIEHKLMKHSHGYWPMVYGCTSTDQLLSRLSIHFEEDALSVHSLLKILKELPRTNVEPTIIHDKSLEQSDEDIRSLSNNTRTTKASPGRTKPKKENTPPIANNRFSSLHEDSEVSDDKGRSAPSQSRSSRPKSPEVTSTSGQKNTTAVDNVDQPPRDMSEFQSPNRPSNTSKFPSDPLKKSKTNHVSEKGFFADPLKKSTSRCPVDQPPHPLQTTTQLQHTTSSRLNYGGSDAVPPVTVASDAPVRPEKKFLDKTRTVEVKTSSVDPVDELTRTKADVQNRLGLLNKQVNNKPVADDPPATPAEREQHQRDLDSIPDHVKAKLPELPIGFKRLELEIYLSDEVFEKEFGHTREKYNSLPRWKKDRLKKDNGFF
ncbi:hypothetical protein GEMRC1_007248 [Eukaryota sp. GEM-RC1]